MQLLSKAKQSSNYKWWAAATMALGTLITVADVGEVNIAMPTIAGRFSSDLSTVQWLATGYLLATSAFLMPMGRLSDMIGRKKVYLWGILIFILGAGLAGSAPNLTALIFFRILQGMGMGMVVGNQMAIITSIFPADERGKVLGFHMTMVGTGLIIGPAIGGGLVEAFGWRSVFYLNVPLGALCFLSGLLLLDETKITRAVSTTDQNGFDWIGAFLSSSLLLVLIIGLINPLHWALGLRITLLTLCAFLLMAFVIWEMKTAVPMLDMTLFKARTFSLGVTARAISFLGAASILFLMPFYFQGVSGYTPVQTGLIMTGIAFGMAVVGLLAGRLSDRFGWRPFTVTGAALAALGLFSLSRITVDTTLPVVMLGILLQSSGMGMFNAPNASSILSVTPRKSYGVISGFVQLLRTASMMIGIAIATLVITTIMSSLGFEANLKGFSEGVNPDIGRAFTSGLRTVYRSMAWLQVAVIVLSLVKSIEVEKPLGDDD